MAVCWVILRGQQIYTVIQAVHSLLYIVAKCHFFSVVTWKDILKYLQKCEGCTHFCDILYIHTLNKNINATYKVLVPCFIELKWKIQSSSVQWLCSFAHLNLFFLLPSLRYGFFFAALPRRPASRGVASSLLMLRLVFCGYYLMKLSVEGFWGVCFSN